MQNKFNRIIQRIFPVLACIAFVVCMVLPVHAADLIIFDYSDYVVGTSYGDSNNVILCSFPINDYSSWTKQVEGSNVKVYGSKCVLNDVSVAEQLWWYPLGSYGVLDMTYIPDGTVMNLDFNITYSGADGVAQNVANEVTLTYYDSYGNTIKRTEIEGQLSSDAGNYVYQFALEHPANVSYVRIYVHYLTSGLFVKPITFNAGNMSLEFSIPALVALQQETGKTNKLLQDILQGSSDGQQAADDFNNSMGEMTPDIQDDLDKMDEVTQPDLSGVDTDLESLVGSDGVDGGTKLLGALTGYSLVSSQFIVVCTLMLAAYVFYGKRG